MSISGRIPPNTEINSSLKILNLINIGSYAEVYKVIYKGIIKALRVPIQISECNIHGMETVIDIDILSRIRHANLMYSEELVYDSILGGISVIMPYAPQTLADINKKLTLYESCIISFKVISAANYLLSNNFLHLDIKPQNILFATGQNNFIHPLLADFDMVVRMDHPKTPVLVRKPVITLCYRPYELFTGNNMMGEYTLVWQLGILLLFTIAKTAIPGDNDEEIKAYILKYFVGSNGRKLTHSMRILLSMEIRNTTEKELAVDLLCGMLNIYTEERYTMQKVMDHPFWNIIKKDKSLSFSSLETSSMTEKSSSNLTLSCSDGIVVESVLSLNETVSKIKFTEKKTSPENNVCLLVENISLETTSKIGYFESDEEFKIIPCFDSIKRLYNMIVLLSRSFDYDHIPMGIFFAGTDLIYRSIHFIANDDIRTVIIHNITCNLIAWKLYYLRLDYEMFIFGSEDIEISFVKNNPYAKKYNIVIQEIMAMEIDIILKLKGKLYRSYIFDSTPLDLLIICIDNLLMNSEAYCSYNENSIANASGKENIRLILKEKDLFPDD
jgi:serine/threonine protein kinase